MGFIGLEEIFLEVKDLFRGCIGLDCVQQVEDRVLVWGILVNRLRKVKDAFLFCIRLDRIQKIEDRVLVWGLLVNRFCEIENHFLI